MPKLKTHKAAKKRFHLTGSGKLMRMKGGASHLRRRKAMRAKRLYDRKLPVAKVDAKRLQGLLPYDK